MRLAPAPSDGAAAAAVRVGLSAGAAVVVRRAAPRARHVVLLQRPVAHVAARGQDAPVRLRIQLELRILVRHTLRYRSSAPRSQRRHRPSHRRRRVAASGRRVREQNRGD